MSEEDTTRKLMGRMAAIGAVCVAVAIALLIVLDGDNNEPPVGSSPTGTVRQFLTAAAVESNGDVACRYLTTAEKLRVERAARARSCAEGFYAGTLTLGGEAHGGDLKVLAFAAAEHGDSAVVTVSAGTSALRLGLAPANASERNEFDAPATSWRIESGAEALVRR